MTGGVEQRASWWLAVGLAGAAVWGGLSGCARRPAEEPVETPDRAAELAEALGDPLAAAAAGWVTIFDPLQAWSGYTLALYRGRTPVLLDMNGRFVRAWPELRMSSRVRLTGDCSLLGFGSEGSVRRFGWEGDPLWQFSRAQAVLHHDAIELANGNILLLSQVVDSGTDDILEVGPSGEVVWEWHAREHLTAYLGRGGGDLTHFNSVQELPDNPWYRSGDLRFRPGNLLVSSRNLNALFVIDRKTGEAVWRYADELDLQHEARMIEPGFLRAGRILLFNNNFSPTYAYRQSVVREIDPDGEVGWEYRSEGFWSPTSGMEQPLPNGNVMIASSRGRRVFEVTREGRTVWEWAPPFDTMRPERYAYDHCPQLAALPRPPERAVVPAPGYRHVDPPVYRFTRDPRARNLRALGKRFRALSRNRQCHRLLLPGAPKVWVAYGLDRQALSAAGRTDYTADFRMWLRDAGSGEELELLRDRVRFGRVNWKERRVDVDGWDYRWVEACIDTTLPDGTPARPELATWANPSIQSRLETGEAELPEQSLTPAEVERQRRHLRALGYVE